MENEKQNRTYDDIINLPHHQSKTRPHMSVYDRAAQFSPFAALTGYEDAVKETARLTDQRMELSEERKEELSTRLALLQKDGGKQREVSITYFAADQKKDGGAYVTRTGIVKRIDGVQRLVIMRDGTIIPVDDIAEIDFE